MGISREMCWKLALCMLICQLMLSNCGSNPTLVMRGDNFSVECHTTEFEFTRWFKDGSDLIKGNRFTTREIELPHRVISILSVADANMEDSGQYKCVEAEDAVHMQVIVIPPMLGFAAEDGDTDGQRIIENGQPLVLDCSISSTDNNLNVKWYKGDEALNASDSHFIFENKTLKVAVSSDDDAGIYTCMIEGGSINRTFTVCSKPRIIESSGVSMNQVQGDTLTLKCAVAGSPMPKVTWLKAGQAIENVSRISYKGEEGDSMFNLIISDLVDEDRGEYTCVAESDGGSVNSTTLVRVKDKLAALWPFLGIVAEVGVLCTIIFIYEKRRSKQEFEESDTDQSPDIKNVSDNKEKDVRQRK